MTVIDLTHTITEEMPVYPDTEQPKFFPASSFERDHYRETDLHLWSHTGTHMDAPAHLFADGAALDTFPAERFVGKAHVVDCRDLQGDARIPASRLDGMPEDTQIVLILTGHAAKWGTPAYFEPFPVPDTAFCEELVRRGIRGLGIDAISVDPIGNTLPNHRLMLAAGMYFIENLRDLDRVPAGATVCALPLKWRQADGAPARVIAIAD